VISDAAITPLRRLQAALPYVVVLAVGVFLYHEADSFEFEQVSGRIGPGATLAYLFLLPVLGFFLATIIFSFVLMYLGQYRKPLQVTALSIAIAFAFMFMFMRVVYVSLPLGIAPFDEVSYALMATMGVH
jgi:ABC-type Na+ efflux pump permease subunit